MAVLLCGSISRLSLLSATAVLLVWFNKTSSSEIQLDDLKKEAEIMRSSLLRKKDKNTFMKAVASTLLKDEKVVLSHSDYSKVTQEDVTIAQPN